MSAQKPLELQNEIVKRFNNGESAASIGRSLGLFTTAITRILKRHGCKMKSGKGPEHSGWKGGRGIKSGYWTVYAPDHPRALNTGRVWEHILVMEKHLGRYIRKGEVIHHIDLDRLNNDIGNLYLCSGNSEHQSAHNSLDDVVTKLIKNGTICFKDGVYSAML